MRGSRLSVLVSLVCVGGVSAQTRPALPAEVDLMPRFRELGLPTVSQGPRGTCSLFAVAGAANFEWARDQSRAPLLATEFLIWAAKEACGKSRDQAMFYEAVAGLNAFGICREELMPYNTRPDPDLKPSDEALREARRLSNRWNAHWIRLWDVRKRMSDAQMVAIREAIAQDHPVACGLRWPRKDELKGLINPPEPEGVRDGHSILLVGYRDDPSLPGGGVFRFRNSSGPKWCEEGYGWMSYAYVRSYANDALWLELLPPGGEVPIQRLEAEDLEVAEKDKCEAAPQATDQWGSKLWSGGKHLDCTAEKDGFVTLRFEVKEAGTYRVRVLATAGPEYGRVRAAIDGQEIREVFDLRSGRTCPGGSLELGRHTLTAGTHTLRISSVGASSRWSGWSFGVDAVDLLPASR